MYIYSSSAISCLDSFDGIDFINLFDQKPSHFEVVKPNYKDFIKPMVLRRMAEATRMATACGLNCLKAKSIEKPEAIIVGTGLGAILDTQKFLKLSNEKVKEQLLPPTSFIQSGHNSVSGQLALLLKAHAYNMTHVQKGVSFEHALLDAKLSVSEGKTNVLVGAVDEKTPLLNHIADLLELPKALVRKISEGASFFLVGKEQENSKVQISQISIEATQPLKQLVDEFIQVNLPNQSNLKAVFYGFNLVPDVELKLDIPTYCYTNLMGQHYSSSGFGVHLATEWLSQMADVGQQALVVNQDLNFTGFTILTRV